jgi:hypothetical protein
MGGGGDGGDGDEGRRVVMLQESKEMEKKGVVE